MIATNFMVTIAPSKEFYTFIPLIEPNDYQPLFGNAKIRTKKWDALQIQLKPPTLFDVAPSSVELSGIECVTFER